MKRMQVLFRLGSWVLIVTGILHLVGHFSASPPPADASEAELLRLLTSYTRDFGLFERSTMDFLEGYSLTFAVLVLFTGFNNLALLGVLRGRAKGLQVLTLTNVLLSAVLTALSWQYFILAPLVCFASSLVLFVLALAAGHYQSEWELSSSANLAPD